MARSLHKKNYDPRISFATANQNLRYGLAASSNLAAWFEFSGDPGVDGSGNDRNGTNNGVVASSDTPYTTDRDNASGDFGFNKSISFSSSAGLSPMYTETAFSFSFWVKLSGASYADQRVFQMGNITTGFRIEIDNTDLVVTDQAYSTTDPVNRFNSFFSAGQWTHVVIRFDRELPGYAVDVFKNGSKVAADSSTSAAGTRYDFSGGAYIGQSGASSDWVRGNLDSFTIWNSLISDDDIKAIYDSTAGVFEIRSGIISNPTRIMLQDQDNHTGSYPTLARTGDPDFLGTHLSHFDDTNTIVFSTDNNIVYPTGLPESGPGSKFVSGGVVTPNVLQGLTTVGSCSAGIADTHISFTPGESITPFNESRVYLDNDTAFYATGTASGTLPGFAQRLSSKTILTIDINPTETTKVAFSSGTAPNASGLAEGVNSGLAYFNFQQKKWEIVGDLSTGSNIDYMNSDLSLLTGSMLSIVPAKFIGTNLASWDLQPFNAALGSPTDIAGFPYATKFNATSSQLYNTTASITNPFLLEKVELRFSGVIGTYPMTATTEQVQISSFMLALQREQPVTASVETFFETYRTNVDVLEVTGTTFESNMDRRIIWYGRIGNFALSSFDNETELSASFPATYAAADLWLPKESFVYPTGSFVIKSVPQVPGKQPRATDAYDGRYWKNGEPSPLFGRQKAGRDLRDSADGRSFIRSVIGTQIVSSSISYMPLAAGGYIPFTAYLHESQESPFVLLPGDKLVLMHANQGFGDPNQTALTVNTEDYIAKHLVNNLAPGGGTLTLFGSLLHDNLPIEPESNQPLTSDAIHEDLHYDNPVYDQWDVEPEHALTGSYVDLIITGSMFATGVNGVYGDPSVDNARGVVASVANGQAGTTGSLQRFVRLTDSVGTVYDSYPPSTTDIIRKSGKGLFATHINFSVVSVAAPTGSHYIGALGGQDLSGSDSQWYMRTAYEIESKRQLTVNYAGYNSPIYDGSNSELGNGPVKQLDTVYVFGSGSLFGYAAIASDEKGDSNNLDARKNSTRWLWGFGDSAYNLPMPNLRNNVGGFYKSTPTIRGYKYGLGGIFGSRVDSRWRRDRYGQFRDMLEQRRFPVTLDKKGGLLHPVSVAFVLQDGLAGELTDPAKTHSQNLSTHATSTMPYYDGLTKDRTDDPDITLEPIEINIDVS